MVNRLEERKIFIKGEEKCPNRMFMHFPDRFEAFKDKRFDLLLVERKVIDQCVEYCGGNLTHAAILLGLDRRTLARKIGKP
jgi:ActR/RegA family two-component response regulator